MLRQKYLSNQYWTYVAGYIKSGETAEETAVREVREELGLVVDQLEYGGICWFANREQLMHGFIGFTKKADFKPSIEVDAAEWVPFTEAPDRMFPEKPGNRQHPLYQRYLQITNDLTEQMVVCGAACGANLRPSRSRGRSLQRGEHGEGAEQEQNRISVSFPPPNTGAGSAEPQAKRQYRICRRQQKKYRGPVLQKAVE